MRDRSDLLPDHGPALSDECAEQQACPGNAPADPTRLQIVGDMVARVGPHKRRVSSQPMCLRRGGLVTTVRHGRYAYDRIDVARVAHLVRLARTVLVDSLGPVLASGITDGGPCRNE